ncbi:tryptophan synthase subunit alpha [Ruminiclostridium herbifermentans]|uniref:Tryptophan synthase alpha chain n=1 Tax=Ruminiclostridium herbifermentans TaxID=2488810 RepID=A0A4U7JLT8_9FIRM|nr:tryptophan synthase subunit alpha [Ruminiclostridium herbifermentans]QNU66228.1 tryptophan synthase subunit alpha [Ruminiclostridium herbifermentans]
MSRINNAFVKDKAFIGFVTGGDPSIRKSEDFIMRMIEAGADLIEIGIPFSDPIAEGLVIQRANTRALAAGTTMDKLFALVMRLRRKTDVPLVFLTYINPVFRYGYDAFFNECQRTGIDGVIIPDLPFEEQAEVCEVAYKHGVDIISLIAPTSEERIDSIAKSARGFIYIVSSMGVTGVREKITTDLAAMVKRIKRVKNIPTAVGFGISTPTQAEEIAQLADGVIVGSAIVKLIELYGENADDKIFEYVKEMKEAIKGVTS